jgi:hypothetical protein
VYTIRVYTCSLVALKIPRRRTARAELRHGKATLKMLKAKAGGKSLL